MVDICSKNGTFVGPRSISKIYAGKKVRWNSGTRNRHNFLSPSAHSFHMISPLNDIIIGIRIFQEFVLNKNFHYPYICIHKLYTLLVTWWTIKAHFYFFFQKITILRDPLDNFVSSYKYYNGMYKDLRKSLPYYTENKDHEFVEGKGTSKIKCLFEILYFFMVSDNFRSIDFRKSLRFTIFRVKFRNFDF